jgi:hypothetical protein
MGDAKGMETCVCVCVRALWVKQTCLSPCGVSTPLEPVEPHLKSSVFSYPASISCPAPLYIQLLFNPASLLTLSLRCVSTASISKPRLYTHPTSAASTCLLPLLVCCLYASVASTSAASTSAASTSAASTSAASTLPLAVER